MFRKTVVCTALLVVLGSFPYALRAQTILTDALSWFPPQTIALEYSQVSTLRSLPDYQTLRSRFLGKNLRALDSSLAALGLREADIDQMVLGWQGGGSKSAMHYHGIASGTFSAESVRQHAAKSRISSQVVDGVTMYCLPQDPNRTCIAVLDGALGIFGPLPDLKSMLAARAGKANGLSSNTAFSSYVRNAQSDAPIWGVATGPAVSQWFKVWMPDDKNLQMDWAAAFKDVRAISYTVEAADDVHLNVELDCDSVQAASSMRQLLEGVKLVQQLAWKSANPGKANPFENVSVSANNRRVSFKLTTAYSALNQASLPVGNM